MLTILHIGSRLFELFSKEVRVKKQPGRPLKAWYFLKGAFIITENPVNISLTINYDDNTLSDDKTCVRWLLLHVSTRCDGVRVRAALSLVESYDPAVCML